MEQYNVSLMCEVINEASSTDALEPSIDVMAEREPEREPERVISEFKVKNEFSLLDVDVDFMSSEQKMSPRSMAQSYSPSSLDQLLDSEHTIVVSPIKNYITTEVLPIDDINGEPGFASPIGDINDCSRTEFVDTQCNDMLTVELQPFHATSFESSIADVNITEINKVMTMVLDHNNVQTNNTIEIAGGSKNKIKSKLKQQNDNLGIAKVNSTVKISTSSPTKSPVLYVDSVHPLNAIQKKVAFIDAQLDTLGDKSDKMIKLKKNLNVEIIRVKKRQARQPAVCSHCSKVFVDKWHMQRHEILHSKQRPFTCQACYRTFTRKDKLNSHKCHAPPLSGKSKKISPSKRPNDRSLPVEQSSKANRLKLSSTKKLKEQPKSAASQKSFKNKNISKNGKPVGTLEQITLVGALKPKTLLGALKPKILVEKLKPKTLVSKKSKEEIINLDSSEDESGANVADQRIANDYKRNDGDSSATESISEFTSRNTIDRTDQEVNSDVDDSPFVMDCENISDDDST